MNIIYFWKNIFGLLVFAAISGGLGFALKQCFEIHGITQLILSIIIYTLIYCVIVGIFGTNAYEKQLIKSVIKRRRMQ